MVIGSLQLLWYADKQVYLGVTVLALRWTFQFQLRSAKHVPLFSERYGYRPWRKLGPVAVRFEKKEPKPCVK